MGHCVFDQYLLERPANGEDRDDEEADVNPVVPSRSKVRLHNLQSKDICQNIASFKDHISIRILSSMKDKIVFAIQWNIFDNT